MGIRVHLLDGTYELFRHHYGAAAAGRERAGREAPAGDSGAGGGGAGAGGGEDPDHAAATRGVVFSVLGLLESGVTHLGVATDHVVESFRNDMWPTYKSSAGMPPELLAQFPLVEEALAALGVVVWPMVDLEADDALAASARTAAADPTVDQVVIMTPDKDLSQCVTGTRVVQLDRRAGTVTDAEGVVARYGVAPESIPDWLALVGDSSDGFPGLAGWGKVGASTVLARYRHLEDIPPDARHWEVSLRGRERLAATLTAERELALLFRDLATLRADAPVLDTVDTLRWQGPTPELADVAERIRARGLLSRVEALAGGGSDAGAGAASFPFGTGPG